jgi:hypothetical protein
MRSEMNDQQFGFPLEPGYAISIPGELFGQDLNRHIPAKLRVLSAGLHDLTCLNLLLSAFALSGARRTDGTQPDLRYSTGFA